MRSLTLWTAAATTAAAAYIGNYDAPSNSLLRRQDAVTFPPVLTENEAILSASFDNVSIAEWSYYYTHGLHVAGTNKTIAQWTVDRWNENGFSARLVEYCAQFFT